jgi:hypothetical protein
LQDRVKLGNGTDVTIKFGDIPSNIDTLGELLAYFEAGATADIEASDTATVAGTPLNKATLLDDDTAEVLELSGDDATPNKAFKAINAGIEALAEEVANFSTLTIFSTTLLASSWNTNQYTITNSTIKAHTSTQETMFDLSLLEADFGGITAATDVQHIAWISLGGMTEVSCVDGAYTFEIDGDVPTVDIPVLIEISRATRV